MLNLEIFRIPVRVQGFFWLSAFLLGGGLSIRVMTDWISVLVFAGVLFFSVLVHELGHALAVRFLGGSPRIILHALGGVTLLGQTPLTRWQHLAIVAAGPMAGLLMGLISVALLLWGRLPVEMALEYSAYINIVWTLFNLLPVLPMDGGQMFRDLVGPRFEKLARVVGMITAILVGVAAYQYGFYIAAVLLGIMAWLNFKGSIQSGGVQRGH
ncbi:MAG: hypothetical protein HC904_01780 [Blastochloris sp.]|nr:hypothetical protein [Blastochloris sp.]